MTNIHHIRGIPEIGTLDLQADLNEDIDYHTLYYTVTSFSVARNRQTYDILGLVPNDWQLFLNLDTDNEWYASMHKKRVVIGYPMNMKNLTATLHEIGHARDIDHATPIERLFIEERRERYIDGDGTLKESMLVLSEECQAWDFALQELQRMNLGRDAMILAYYTAHEGVRSYVAGISEFSKRISQNEKKDPADIQAEILAQFNRCCEEMTQKYGVGK